LRYHKRRGNFTHADAKPEEHLSTIIHDINHELEELYANQNLANELLQKLGSMQQQTKGQGINPSDVKFRKAGFFSASVWQFDLNDKEEVAKGNFGRILLNRHHFTLRTNHHRYAMNIAAQLFFFQVFALAGKDPKTIQSNNKYIKKCGEIVLAKTGKIKESSDLNEGAFLTLIKHDRKIDDDIAESLHLTQKDLPHIETALSENVRSVHDIVNDVKQRNWRALIPKEEARQVKNLTLIEKETARLRRLAKLMAEKSGSVRQVITEGNLEDADARRLGAFAEEWNKDQSYIQAMLGALEQIRNNEGNWSHFLHESHNWLRIRRASPSDIANRLSKEGERKKIDINKIHALITSFTAEKGRILQELHSEEGVLVG
jgi:hypothetical protein